MKRNKDSTFSGVLVQYDLSSKEKDLFNDWHSINPNNKIKIYNINNLSLKANARTVYEGMGCFTLAYKDGMCSEGVHAYGAASASQCVAAVKPQAPRILSITTIPGCGADNG